MRIGILPFDIKHGRQIGSIGSSMIRCHWPLKYWPEAEIFKIGQKYDAVIYQKVYWEEHWETYDGIKILDLCDPDWLDNGLEIKRVEEYFDAITCSSEGLVDFFKKILKKTPVYYIPDRLDLEFFNNPKEHYNKAKTVAWFGYYHNAIEVLQPIIPLLAENELKLLVISNNKINFPSAYSLNVDNKDFSWDTIKYNLQKADIVINPLANKARYKYKSSNKTLISWACGLPVANSDTEMLFYLDANKRNSEIKARLKEIKEKWDCRLSIKQYMDIIEKACQTKNKK